MLLMGVSFDTSKSGAIHADYAAIIERTATVIFVFLSAFGCSRILLKNMTIEVSERKKADMENRNCFIHETAIVEKGVTIGANTKVWHHCHLRSGAVIADNVNIGKGVYIDSGVVIGNNVRIQNGVSLYKGVTIEDDVFLGPHCNFTNDLFPRANSSNWQVIPTLIKKGASIGSNATIICGVTVGKYSLISVGAVVTEDTLPFSLMIGHPARLKGFVCKCGQKMKKTGSSGNKTINMICESCRKKLKIEFHW